MYVYRTIGEHSNTNLNILKEAVTKKTPTDVWFEDSAGRIPRVSKTDMYFDTPEEAYDYLNTLLIDRLAKAEVQVRFLDDSIKNLCFSRWRHDANKEGEG